MERDRDSGRDEQPRRVSPREDGRRYTQEDKAARQQQQGNLGATEERGRKTASPL
jgi:hypothetical protein